MLSNALVIRPNQPTISLSILITEVKIDALGLLVLTCCMHTAQSNSRALVRVMSRQKKPEHVYRIPTYLALLCQLVEARVLFRFPSELSSSTGVIFQFGCVSTPLVPALPASESLFPLRQK